MDTNIIINIMSVIIAFIALVLVYKIHTFNRLSNGWLTLAIGLGFVVIRRILVLASSVGWLSSEWSSKITIIDTYLYLITITLYVIGLWSMYKSFESFDIIEKRKSKGK